MTPNPRLHPVSDKGETSAGVANREVLHPTAQDRIDLLDHSAVRSKYSNVLRPWVMSPKPRTALGKRYASNSGPCNVVCYVRFECFSLLRNSGIINGSEISNLQNWTVGLGASRKNAFGPEGWAAIPACFIPICAGACACMGHWIVRSSRNHYWIQTDRVL